MALIELTPEMTEPLARAAQNSNNNYLDLGPQVEAILAQITALQGTVANQQNTIDTLTSQLTSGWYKRADIGALTRTSTTTVTTPGDKTGLLPLGTKLRIMQGGMWRYFVLTLQAYSGGVTTYTLYGGTDYTLITGTITDYDFSNAKTPQGFPADPAKWTLVATKPDGYAVSSPTANTLYSVPGLSLAIPPGAWTISCGLQMQVMVSGSNVSSVRIMGALSSSQSSLTLSHAQVLGGFNASSAALNCIVPMFLNFGYNLASAGSLYFLLSTSTSGMGSLNLVNSSFGGTAQIAARCAYI